MISFLALESDTGNNLSYSGAVMNIIWVLIVLVIIIFLIVFVIRFLGQKNRNWSRNQAIRTLGAIGLAQNKSMQVVEIGDSIYIIGVGEDIRLIDKVSDPDEVAVILASFEQNQTRQGQDIAPILSNLMKKFRKSEDSAPLSQEELNTSFHEVFQSKLNRVTSRKQKVEELLQDENNSDRLMDK
ncbi:flagellar biosynthetic protein FliO [Paenibacillus guangzhouensis]|uniref:flagellar biosynthetic protein FliO n=1 Tax=Paenibacillus guangzhouensis TaxID=1473112 RepID=UPI0012669C82|nr:flagellar biosynthetic protein FliO [Paenibacillus guangzhouensis]